MKRKKHLQSFLSILLACLMILGAPMQAFAEDVSDFGSFSREEAVIGENIYDEAGDFSGEDISGDEMASEDGFASEEEFIGEDESSAEEFLSDGEGDVPDADDGTDETGEHGKVKTLIFTLDENDSEADHYECTLGENNEYTVVVPGTKSTWVDFCFEPENPSDKGYYVTTYVKNLTNGVWDVTSMNYSPTRAVDQYAELYVGPSDQYDSPENTKYTIHLIRTQVLKSLTVNSTLRPKFDSSKFAYTVGIPEDSETVSIKPTAKFMDSLLTVNGEKADSGKEYLLTPQWDENGRATVKISLSDEEVHSLPAEYTLTLIKESLGATPLFSVQPEDVECVCLDTRTMEVRAVADGTLTYQWYRNTIESTEGASAVEGATSNILSMKDKVAEDAYYYCMVTNTSADGTAVSAASRIAHAVVKEDPTPVVTVATRDGSPIPADGYTYQVGDTPDTNIYASATSLVDGGTFTYTWKYAGTPQETPWRGSIKGSDFIADTTHDGLCYYGCEVTYKVYGKSYTTVSKERIPVKVIANTVSKPEITTQPVSGKYIVGTKTVTALSINSVYPSDSNISYQWYSSTSPRGTFSIISGATSSSYRPVIYNEPNTTYYKCRVTHYIDSVTGVTLSKYTDSDVVSVEFLSAVDLAGWEGEGTEASPYLLKSAEDMETLSKLVNENGNSFKDVYFKMTGDITLPTGWNPLGTSSVKFSGNIDGGGYLLTIPKGERCLLGYVVNASLSNIDIYGEQIESAGVLENYVVTRGGQFLTCNHVTLKAGTKTLKSGFLGGYASGSDNVTLTNCKVEAGVVIGYDKSQSHIGSFGGELNGVVQNCESYADVYGVDYVGGICGNKGQSMGAYQMINCIFGGTVTASGNFAGGISGGGYTAGSAPNTPAVTIKNCYVNGNITGADYVGGILGAEAGLVQCWQNGIGYIQDNMFSGTVTATNGTYVGGIIGYMNGLNKYNYISNNYYSCNVSKGIGFVKFLDTSCENVTPVDGVVYYNTKDRVNIPDSVLKAANATVYPHNVRSDHNREDDPLGADAAKLTMSATSEDLSSGAITDKLNGSDTSSKNWEQGENGPAMSNKPVLISLNISGDYRKEFYIGEELDLTGLVLDAKWSNGDVTHPAIDSEEVTVEGYDSSKRGLCTLRISYSSATAEVVVAVLKHVPNTIKVSFTLLGDTKHNSSEDGISHTFHDGNLETWISKNTYTVDLNATVMDVLDMVLAKNGMTYRSDEKKTYIQGITREGEEELAELGNGDKSAWMYTLNGYRSPLTINQQFLEDGDDIVFHYTDDYSVEHIHRWSEKWSSDEGYHWHECEECQDIAENSEKDGYGAHTASDWIIDDETSGAMHKECTVCGFIMEKGTRHTCTWDAGKVTKEASCTESGVKTYTCTGCGATRTEEIPAAGHQFGEWTEETAATVFAPQVQKHICAVCGASETKTEGEKLTPTIKLNATSIPLKLKQSTTKIKVSGLANGDSVKSWKSSNTKIVKVNSKGKIVAQKKTGKAYITVTLASGKTAKIKVTVQKAKVATKKLKVDQKKLTLKKGKSQALTVTVSPITSQDKVTYTSSNKKVATVSSKGKITAKKKGTATITIKSGKKTVKCKVTVK